MLNGTNAPDTREADDDAEEQAPLAAATSVSGAEPRKEK
jgi:hypothetical protein